MPRSIERIGIDENTDKKYEQIPETVGRYYPVERYYSNALMFHDSVFEWDFYGSEKQIESLKQKGENTSPFVVMIMIHKNL